MKSVTAPDGRTLAVREGGDPNGVPVFYVAGTPGSNVMYEPNVRDAKERGIRLLSYDRPGYGGSTRDEGRCVADCAADIEAICESLGLAKIGLWGHSGGGPHALAAAALLPHRVVAAATLASVGPYGVEGLDFLDGMGEQNVEEFGITLAGGDAARASAERNRAELLETSPEQLADAFASLVSPTDRAVLTSALAEFFVEQIRWGIGPSADGWFDDDIAFTRPWGFDLASIRVPVLLWQGREDRFVPFAHGVWLAEHISGVEARLTDDDGHLTLLDRVPEVHAWLLERIEYPQT